MRLLADRGSDGITVRLFWDENAPTGTDIVVEYEDRGRGTTYMFHPPSDRALDAFYHPNSYHAFECSDAA